MSSMQSQSRLVNIKIIMKVLLINVLRMTLFTSAYKMSTRIEESIRAKLCSHLAPSHLDIINESYMHNVPKGSETHFKVIIISDKFQNLTLIQRHRMVNDLLKEELQGGVHALSITAKTSIQWQQDSNITNTPNCLGGFGK